MPLRLDVKRKVLARSECVQCVDLHQTETWLLIAHDNGNVNIWNYESQKLVNFFEVCDVPVRAAKFVPRKSWVVTGSDDYFIRIFNYNTLERVHQFEAHSDYLRSLVVHPTLPYVISSSDDMLVKMWDWDNKWAMKQSFEGHTLDVMQIVINPKDNITFATASLDKTVKVWQVGSNIPNFTLEGHEKGVNCVDYYHGGEKPYIISGADDHLVKIWDYQNEICVKTLDGHAQNVSSVCFHPLLSLIITGSEDSTVRLWHANTYRLETTLNYGLERVWCIQAQKGANTVAIGYDEGSVTLKLEREPAVSMDSSGKILWAKHSEIQQASLKTISAEESEAIQDGERLPLSVKDLGSSEIYPQTLAHSSNGRFVVACGDGEYIVYTAMDLRNTDFGQGLEFVWAIDPNMFAVRKSATNVKIKKNFKDHKSIRSDMVLEGISGGPLLALRSNNSLCFFDWETALLVRRIKITSKNVYWSNNGKIVAICGDESFYILKYNAEAVASATEVTEDGIEDAFEVVGEQAEAVKTAFWIGDCFIFTTALDRINYYIGGEIVTIAHVDRPLYLLGHMAKESRVYAVDKDLNVISYKLIFTKKEKERLFYESLKSTYFANFSKPVEWLSSASRKTHIQSLITDKFNEAYAKRWWNEKKEKELEKMLLEHILLAHKPLVSSVPADFANKTSKQVKEEFFPSTSPYSNKSICKICDKGGFYMFYSANREEHLNEFHTESGFDHENCRTNEMYWQTLFDGILFKLVKNPILTLFERLLETGYFEEFRHCWIPEKKNQVNSTE